MEKEDGVFTEETEAVDNGVAGAEPETETTDLPAQTGEADDKKNRHSPTAPGKIYQSLRKGFIHNRHLFDQRVYRVNKQLSRRLLI